MNAVYQVPEANLGLLKQRVAKIARRCKRIKVAEPILTVGQPVDHEYCDEVYGERMRRVYPVTLDSPERPKIEGFEFAAVISPVTDEDGKFLGNVLRLVPGFEFSLPERFRQASNNCDHCNTERRRNETFVIRESQTGDFKQIGRNCLANYLGLTNPHMLAELAQILIDADDLMSMSEDEGGFGGSRVPERVPVDKVLQITASAIRLYGWLSNKSAQEFMKTSTASRVREWIFGGQKTRDQFEHKLEMSDEDKSLAAETEEWLESLNTRSLDSEYLQNLSLLAQATSITAKNFGIVCSAINAYSREKEREIRRNKQFENDKNSRYVGTLGERLSLFNLTVLYTTTFDSDFGVTHFYKMKDAASNVVVYFSSRDMSFEAGIVIPELIASVKKQDEREGVKQTTITRAKLPPYKMTKDEKRTVTKLKRIAATLPCDYFAGAISDTYAAHIFISNLIDAIKRGKA